MSKTVQVFDEIKFNNYTRENQISKKWIKVKKIVYCAIKKVKEFVFISRVGDDYTGYWKMS